MPMSPPDGNVVLLLRDGSAAKAAETALKGSEARLRSLVENAADGIFVHDQDGRFLFCNQVACNETGYTREEFLGLRLDDLIPADEAGAHFEALPALHPGQQITASHRRVRRKDGSTFPAEVRINLIGIGAPRHIMGIGRNLEALGRAPLPDTPA